MNYRPPNSDTTLFEKHMKNILSKNEATKQEVILIGDFNMNLLDFDKDKRVQSFVNLMFRFGMIPTINKPKRVTRHTATTIDHVFTNTIMGNIEIKTAIVKTDISDHFSIIFATKNKIGAEITESYIFKRNISDQSIGKFNQKLRNIDWNNIKILRNVNDAYSKFLEIFLFLYNKCFPKIKVKLKPQRQFNPWITKSIKKAKMAFCKSFLNHMKWYYIYLLSSSIHLSSSIFTLHYIYFLYVGDIIERDLSL